MNVKPIKTILYATDLGDQMRPVMRQTSELAQQFGAGVLMVHIAEPFGETVSAVIDTYVSKGDRERIKKEGMQQVIKTMKSRLKRYCEEEALLSNKKKHGVTEIIVVSGDTTTELLRVAKDKNADMIIMGSCGHKSRGDLLGSVTRKVTQKSKIPVLIVPNNSAQSKSKTV